MKYLESSIFSPYYNLAFEQHVFDCLPRDQSYFLLWQNDNSLIVGRHQNTSAEINASYVRDHGIRVARRLSGGGAVYHDLGNLNYTFITDAGEMEHLDLHAFCIPLVKALSHLGVPAEITGRNDVTIEGQKCSGSSQYIRNGRVMHHGCILFDTDLSVVSNALQVPADKIESKGIRSVRSRVTDIRPYLKQDIGMDEFKEVLKRHMVTEASLTPCSLTQEDLDHIEYLRRERYSTWAWNYGESPRYSVQKARRIEGCGRIELSMDVDHGGTITALAIHGDYFGSGDSDEAARFLIGCPLNRDALRNALDGVPIDYYFSALTAEELIDLLLT